MKLEKIWEAAYCYLVTKKLVILVGQDLILVKIAQYFPAGSSKLIYFNNHVPQTN